MCRNGIAPLGGVAVRQNTVRLGVGVAANGQER